MYANDIFKEGVMPCCFTMGPLANRHALTRNSTQSLESELLRCLAGGVDAQKLDDFLDRLLCLAGELGSVTCILPDEQTIRVQSRGGLLNEAALPLAKAKLRMLCARLAVRLGDWSNQKVSPYGEVLEVEVPHTKQRLRVSFKNTPDSQTLTIDSVLPN
jgi:hypothetical protein